MVGGWLLLLLLTSGGCSLICVEWRLSDCPSGG